MPQKRKRDSEISKFSPSICVRKQIKLIGIYLMQSAARKPVAPGSQVENSY